MTETEVTVLMEAEKEMNHQDEEQMIVNGIIGIIGIIEIIGTIDVIDAVSYHITIPFNSEHFRTTNFNWLLSDDDRDRRDRRQRSRSRSSSRR